MVNKVYLENFESRITDELLRMCKQYSVLDGTLLATDDINARWDELAPEYMADAVPEIGKYPLVAIAWAMYEGMGAAVLWDKEWNRYEAIEDFHKMFTEPRGFDCMDEYITEILLALPLGSKGAEELEDLIRSTAERALSLIRKEQVEAQSVMAFHVFARTTKVMFELGVSVELKRLGYNYVKVNAEVVN